MTGQAFTSDLGNDIIADAAAVDLCLTADIAAWICPSTNTVWAPATPDSVYPLYPEVYDQIKNFFVPGLYLDPMFMFTARDDQSGMMAVAQVFDVWAGAADAASDESIGSVDSYSVVFEDEQGSESESWIVHDSDCDSSDAESTCWHAAM